MIHYIWYMIWDIRYMLWYNIYDTYDILYEIYDICYDLIYMIYEILYMIWYDMRWYMIYDIYDMIWDIWYMLWYNIYDMMYEIWYDMIYDMIHLLTAIGLPPAGSSTVHIYWQQYSTHLLAAVQYTFTGSSTVHRTTQNKQYTEQHKNLGTVRAVPRLGELYPGICLTTEEKARKNLSQARKNLSQSRKNPSLWQGMTSTLWSDDGQARPKHVVTIAAINTKPRQLCFWRTPPPSFNKPSVFCIKERRMVRVRNQFTY
jgi:hypothetical protein